MSVTLDGTSIRQTAPLSRMINNDYFEVSVRLAADDWTPGVDQVIVGSWGDVGHRHWRFILTAAGNLQFEWTEDGTNVLSYTSTGPPAGAVNGQPLWVAASFDMSYLPAGGVWAGGFGYHADGDWDDVVGNFTIISQTAGAAPGGWFEGTFDFIDLGAVDGVGDVDGIRGVVSEIRMYTGPFAGRVLVGPTEPAEWVAGLALTPGVQVIEHSFWPPRLLISAAGWERNAEVTIWRSVGGVRTAVRRCTDVLTRDTALVAVDSEFPFALPITYVVEVDGIDTYTSTPITVDLPGGKVALTDAISGTSVETVVMAWPRKSYERPATRSAVNGRRVVVSDPRGQWSAQVEFLTETDAAAAAMDAFLDGLTEGVMQIRQPGGYGGVDCYVAVLSDSEERLSQDGLDQRRRWPMEVDEVDGWSSELVSPASTLGDIEAAYVGCTMADIEQDFAGEPLRAIELTDWVNVGRPA